VDHINHNGLDNRRTNLRVCTRVQNQGNRKRNVNNVSGYKGVYLDGRRGHWVASIREGGRSLKLGRFPTAEDAALAYNEAATTKWGEYALLNEIPSQRNETPP
jgi:hypothetical protein